MNKSYVSPTKLSCLAVCCMISVVSAGFDSLILGIIAGAAFVFGIAIVSNLEKVANNHIRFVIYALIVSAIFAVFKIVFGHLTSVDFLRIAEGLDYALLSSLVLSILPIYFMHKESSKNYYLKTVATATVFTASTIVVGTIMEVLSAGSIFGVELFDVSPSLLGSSFFAFILLALICVVGTATENYIKERARKERMLIDKYKVMIRDFQIRTMSAKYDKENKDKNEMPIENLSEGGND